MNTYRQSFNAFPLLRTVVGIVLLLGLLIGALIYYFHAKEPTRAHAAGAVQHYFYTFTIGNMYVYDMDNGFKLVKQVPLSINDVRGAVTSPATGMLYITHGGTGGQHGPGAILKYNLLTNSVVWNMNVASGVDSLDITPDGKTLYVPDGDQNSDGKWYVMDAGTGAIKTTITAGAQAHNTVVSLDGKHVFMGGIGLNYLVEADTTTNQVIQKMGPLVNGVRPFTINSAQTLAFTNATNFYGFQVSSITTGQVLYTVPIKGFPAPANGFSHGVSLSPDEKEAYVADAPNSYVHVFDISGLPNTAPKQIADIKLTPITGMQIQCTYDCQKEGWVQHSLDGRYVFSSDSGDVISTATRQIVANMPALANSRISNEIDWSNGAVVAASSRHGLGRANISSTGSTGGAKVTSNGPVYKGPVAKTWYFAEGRVGKNFREYLTIDNPDPTNTCAANVQYLSTPDGTTTSTTKNVTVNVPAGNRATESVNSDLGINSASGSAASVATTVTVAASTPTCTGIVVERPVYFVNYRGISSGTDVVGTTQLGQNFYFADVPAGANSTSYLTILNPNAKATTVTASYFANGQQVQSQSVTVAPNSRGTIPVNAVVGAAHVAATVTANQPVLVERPTYFVNVNGTSGATDIIGAGSLANDWLFSEGYTGTGFQEYLTVANLDPTVKPAAVTITLKSRTGMAQSFPVTVNAHSQLIWNVNQNNTFAGSSPEVSAEVKSTGANIVVQREQYFQYHHSLSTGTVQSSAGTDVVGQVGPASKSAYTFAEGYANRGYSEWLTIQNPTAAAETIQLSIVNGNNIVYDQQLSVGANSRFTLDITTTVLSHIAIPNNIPSYQVAMTVQTLNNGGIFVAERPMYWNTSGSSFPINGGSDVIGYTG